MWLQFSKKVADGSERKFAVTESKILPQYQNSLIAHFAPAGILLGSAFPKPCHAAYAAYPAAAMRQSKGGFTMRKRYNTPHRSRVVKTRMTEEEYAEFAERLSAYNMSQAEFIRQAITGAAIRPIITVSPVNDELLAAVGKLTAEYGRIGGNLNQIARTLNEWPPVDCKVCLGGLYSLLQWTLRSIEGVCSR